MHIQFDIDRKAIGSRLRSARIRNGLTQEKLAEKIGVTSKYISKVENGAATPSLSFVIRFSEITESDLNLLLVDPKHENSRTRWGFKETRSSYGDRYTDLSERGRKLYKELAAGIMEVLEKNDI